MRHTPLKYRFETKKQPPLPARHFAKRLVLHAATGAVIVLFSLLIGIAGYVRFAELSPIDAFLNSAMLMGGMGPVNAPQHTSGKLFAGMYALYAGLVFILVSGLLLAPIVHRVMHRFHWSSGER